MVWGTAEPGNCFIRGHRTLGDVIILVAADVSIGPFVVGGNCCNKCNFSFHFHHITGLSVSLSSVVYY